MGMQQRDPCLDGMVVHDTLLGTLVFLPVFIAKENTEITIKVIFLLLLKQQEEFEDYPKYWAEFLET